MRLLVLALICILVSCNTEKTESQDPSTSTDEQKTRILGTRIYTEIPEGFEVTYDAPQLKNEQGIGLEYWEYEMSLETIKQVEHPSMYVDNPMMNFISRTDTVHMGYEAMEILKHSFFNGDSLARHTLLFGDETFSAYAELSYPLGTPQDEVDDLFEEIWKVSIDLEEKIDPFEHLAFELDMEESPFNVVGTTPTGIYLNHFDHVTTNISLAYIESEETGLTELEQFHSLFDGISVIPQQVQDMGVEVDVKMGEEIDTGRLDGRMWIDGRKYTLFQGDTMDLTNIQILYMNPQEGIVLSGKTNNFIDEMHQSFRDFMKRVTPKEG